MRRIATWLTAVGFGTVLVAAAAAQQPTDAQGVLAAARQALGGDAALAAVKSFSVSGSSMMNLGERTLDQALNIDCELPDKFLRERTIHSQGLGVSTDIIHRDGFNADDLITETITQNSLGLPPPPDINPPRTPEQMAAARKSQVLGNKHEFTKLLLALFASSSATYPLEFSYAGQAPMEHGAVADVVSAKGPDGFELRLFADVTTHLPVMISWRQAPMVIATLGRMVAVPRGQGPPPISSPPPPTVPPPPQAAVNPPPGGIVYSGVIPARDATAGLPLVEHQLSLGDYRTSDGLTWPHRLTDHVEGQVAEDVKLGKFRINPRINPRNFKSSR